jgi:hypothetical protein
MSPPPHRKKDAKVEGRDPMETAPKETMAPFRSLMGRLLKVKPEDVAEQQSLYEQERGARNGAMQKLPKKIKKGVNVGVAGQTTQGSKIAKSRSERSRERQKS